MNGALAIVASILAFVAISVALFIWRSMFSHTRGRRIPAHTTPRAALLVMDLQEGYAGSSPRQPATTPASAHGFFGTVNRLIDHAAASGMEVAYVRQVFSSNLIVRLHGGRRSGKVIIDRRVKVINGNDFAKNRTDAFSCPDLEHFLIDRQVSELYLVGADAAFCIYFTALGALSRGYRVTVIADAVVSRRPLAKIVEKYRCKGIGFITSAQFLEGNRQS